MIKTSSTRYFATNTIWLIPFLFFIHNLEEAFQMPQYLANQFSIHFITNKQFFIAISILTTLVLLIVILYQLSIISSMYWIIFIQGCIFFNAVQHVILFVIYRSYNPGVISASIIILFSLFLFSSKKLLIHKRNLAITLIFSLLSYPIIIWITLLFASCFQQ
ncbi:MULTISPECIES: HXXEE domain-containing protein [Bacillus cereus group]|uniref:HXXEE domain-containing protein n=1 Tax=Bacillus paramycoides TaxID=2026194 RepID=A0ABU6MZY1_9BACI|nr:MULTISPECIES: HXXEE domain-containing protein [Bacillus cereus group]PFD37200.1 HXXEE domain-containing protein [Bacillus cereus]MED0966871.1 HXXEE domain-containing protein [Bacillus paramycoides]MED0972350.1 HXXEE domain-containing protein [Bacillus paramycoides]MED0981912.1 HXXEE domain-containing protein [Bacillus paramycoides]MED0984314.1 HXXEE domain-containing protein [Bacillus paramycoides]